MALDMLPTLETLLTVLGWVLMAVPLGLFAFVSAHLILTVAKEDSLVQLLVFLLTTAFIVGAGILGVVYGTNWLSSI